MYILIIEGNQREFHQSPRKAKIFAEKIKVKGLIQIYREDKNLSLVEEYHIR